VVIVDVQRLVEVDGIHAVRVTQLPNAVEEKGTPGLVGWVYVPELAVVGRVAGVVPDEPLLLVGSPRLSDVVRLELLVQRMIRVAAKVVQVRHDVEAQCVRVFDKGPELRRRVIVRVQAVVAVGAPVRDVDQGLLGVNAFGRQVQRLHAATVVGDDDAANVLHPSRLLVGDRRQVLPGPLDVPPRRHAPVALVDVDAPLHRLAGVETVERRVVPGREADPPALRLQLDREALVPARSVLGPDVEAPPLALDEDKLCLPEHRVFQRDCRR